MVRGIETTSGTGHHPGSRRITVLVSLLALVAGLLAVARDPAAEATTPRTAVSESVAAAARQGVTQYVSVVDRTTGSLLADTANAGSQVAAESVMKLFLATYYILIYGGYQSTPAAVLSELSYMLRYSDDATADNLFTDNAIPTVASRYGLRSTTNATDRAGHWGAARITATDMTTFLYRMSKDSEVGPWLIPVMAQSAPQGSDGFDQHFGLNALTGTHGSKQGWGCDSFFTAQLCAINSVGYTSRYFVAILQTSDSYPDPARETATATAQAIADSSIAVASPPPPAPPRNGDFLRVAGSSEIYRLVGGAPIYIPDFSAIGHGHTVKTVSRAVFSAYRQYPADGTFVRAGTAVYRIAGGAPMYVSSWAALGGSQATTTIDAADITQAGSSPRYTHLRTFPTDGTFVRAGTTVYRIAGGAPIYVSNWAAVGGSHPTTSIDAADISRAGAGGSFGHLRAYPADDTFLQAGTTVYRIAGGAPIYVSNFAKLGKGYTKTYVDPAAIADAGAAGRYSHLRVYPADGTFVVAGATTYRIAGGAPVYVANFATLGKGYGRTYIDPAAVSRASTGGPFSHLRIYPADGTFVVAGSTTYRIAGGAPLYVPDFSSLGAGYGRTYIDPVAVSRAGTGGQFNHLRFYPADHTFLAGKPGGAVYQVLGGVPHHITSWKSVGGQKPVVWVNQATITQAGGPAPYNHLKK